MEPLGSIDNRAALGFRDASFDAISEVVVNYGFLFPRGDVHAPRERIRETLKDPTRVQELGRRDRAWIETRFSQGRMLASVTEIFEGVIARPASG